MIGTPAALEPWRPQLELLDPYLRVSVGALVSRLALLVGPLRAEGGGRGDEPDGFDGLDHRGSYEHLLATEWLLASELPEEFLRRAAEHEHLFHRLARSRPTGTRRSVVLFDGGPSQLGSPRVAQLAALLMFAARAEKGGARFGWGVIQDPALHEEVSPTSVLRLLAGRSVRDATEADLLAWRERLGTPGASDDLWCVGGRPLAGLAGARAASMLRVDDLLEPSVRWVRVAVSRPAKPQAPGVDLELPPAPVCVRLLRDPFSASRPGARATTEAMGAASNLLFSAKGNQLLGRTASGSVWIQPLTNSPAATPGNLIRAHVGPLERLVAAGFHGRRASLVVRVDEQYLIRETGRRGGPTGPPVPILGQAELGDAGEHLLPFFTHRIGTGTLNSEERFLLTPNGRLLSVLKGNVLAPLAERVVAVAPFFGQVAWASAGTPEKPGRALDIHDGFAGNRLPVDLGDHPSVEVFFGFGGGHDQRSLRGLAAVRIARDSWRLICGGPDAGRELGVPEGRVVGVSRDGTQGGAPALVVLDADERSLSLASASTRRVVHRSKGRIAQAVCSHADPRVAWLTEAGEVVVWSLDGEQALMRLEHREAS